MRADEIKIESEDRGFELHVAVEFTDAEIKRAEEDGWISVNVHGCAVDLYNEVVSKIGPWIMEGITARDEYRTGISGDPLLQVVLDRIRDLDGEEAGDEIERATEMIDLARKAAKENR